MKGTLVALDEIDGRKAAARLVDGVLDDLLISPAAKSGPPPGSIFRAICDRPLKGQGGMMLRLPEGAAYLRQGKGLKPGQPLLVQVTSYAEEGKAVPVTDRILFKSRYAIVTPGAPGFNISRKLHDDARRERLLEIAHEMMPEDGFGLILRTAAHDGADEEIAADIAAMGDLATTILSDGDGPLPELLLDGPDAHLLAWRDWPGPDLLDDETGSFARHGIDSLIALLGSSRVDLPGGATMFIEPTRALTAVDVNTGPDSSPAAGLKANIASARALPRHLRCRGIGGQITLDLAPMPKKDRRQLEAALRAGFRADPVETVLAGWTPLGHFELQRKRERPRLSEAQS